ncbi:HNH endonuclease [Streptomyces sp. NPDC047706]|uniref:HNH endonuclease n=1 Tax=Streptomyces sp. NPDC047706 TaxID=3365486 RepID=UPI00371AF1AB
MADLPGVDVANATCSIEGCDDRLIARGWCSKHYQRWKTHGTPNAPGKTRRGCTVDGCDRPRFGQGYCRLHYDRWRAHGDPAVSKLNRQHDGRCEVEGCDRPYKGRGLCHLHLRRLNETGTTNARVVDEPAKCKAGGCSRRAHGQGLCSTHYSRLRKSGTTDDPVAEPRPSCSIEGCTGEALARGLCSRHYQKLKAHGDPNKGGNRRSGRGLICEAEGCGAPYSSNGFCVRHALRDYQRRNPEKLRAWRQRRGKRLKAGATSERSATIEYRAIIIRDPCVYCGAPAEAIDHIESIANGGLDSWENLAPVCTSCNCSKQAKDLLDFLMYRSGGGSGGGRVRPCAASRSV